MKKSFWQWLLPFLIILVSFSWFCLILSHFWWYSDVLEKIKKSKMAEPRWRLLGSHDVISTSYDVIFSCSLRQKKHLWTYYVSSKFRCCSFNNLGETEGGCPSPPRSEKTKKSPVWIGLTLFQGVVMVCPFFQLVSPKRVQCSKGLWLGFRFWYQLRCSATAICLAIRLHTNK